MWLFRRVYQRYLSEITRLLDREIGQNCDIYSPILVVLKLLMNSRNNLHIWNEQFRRIREPKFRWKLRIMMRGRSPQGGRGFVFFFKAYGPLLFYYIVRVSQLSILSLQGTHKHQSIYNPLNLDDTFFYVTATCTTH